MEDPISSREIAHATAIENPNVPTGLGKCPTDFHVPASSPVAPQPPQQPSCASNQMAGNLTRLRALALYKELRQLGRDYPDPSYDFNGRVRRLFEKNKNLTDSDEIEKALKMGEYIKKETLALYSLRKYRHLKRMYPDSMSDP